MPEKGIAGGREQAALVFALGADQEGRRCGAERWGRVALKGALNSAIPACVSGPGTAAKKCKALGKKNCSRFAGDVRSAGPRGYPATSG